ncbi:MAG: hypothetical protein JNK87_13525 [Bryobacterales bacterium]|nr:hypothetical protein [Bryobacterales bacterium]
MSTFTVRTVDAESRQVEIGQFDLIPQEEHAEAVCDLFLRFLADRPPGFREELPFLKQPGTELEWAAAEGGAALASFYDQGQPVSMGILLAGLNEEADKRMLDGLRATAGYAIFREDVARCLDAPERPVLINILFPESPELRPRVQLLATALASVFFRIIAAIKEAEDEENGDRDGGATP